jgi:DNA polymerase I
MSNVLAKTVRNCIVSRPNHTLIFADFDQIEMRVLASFSKDKGLIDAFHSDADFFVVLSRQIYNDDSIVKSDPRRQLTKNACYAKIYCAGAAKFAETAGISVQSARSFLTRFDELYPRVKKFQSEIIGVAKQRQEQEGVAYVKSILTGRRFIAEKGKEYALVNYEVQGVAAEIFKMKLVEIDSPYLILPIHDEFVLDVPNEEVPETVENVMEVMNDDTILSVPITASVGYGKRWGEKRDWNHEEWLRSLENV